MDSSTCAARARQPPGTQPVRTRRQRCRLWAAPHAAAPHTLPRARNRHPSAYSSAASRSQLWVCLQPLLRRHAGCRPLHSRSLPRRAGTARRAGTGSPSGPAPQRCSSTPGATMRNDKAQLATVLRPRWGAPHTLPAPLREVCETCKSRRAGMQQGGMMTRAKARAARL